VMDPAIPRHETNGRSRTPGAESTASIHAEVGFCWKLTASSPRWTGWVFHRKSDGQFIGGGGLKTYQITTNSFR